MSKTDSALACLIQFVFNMQLLTLFKENKEDDPRKKELVVSKILKHAETELLKSQSLVTADGKPNDEQIKA